MFEFNKKFYLYDRWFEYQKEKDGKLIYISVPKNTSSRIKIEISKSTNEITLFYLNGRQLLKTLTISDITKQTIEFYYKEYLEEDLVIGKTRYANTLIELFATTNKGKICTEKQIKIIKKKNRRNKSGLESLIPLNEKLNINDVSFKIDKVEDFISFVSTFSIHMNNMIKNSSELNYDSKEIIDSDIKELVIPQKLVVYDRAYHFSKIQDNKIFLNNDEEEERTLQIRFDPVMMSLLSIHLTIDNSKNMKKIIRIIPNDINGITVRYYNKQKQNIILQPNKTKLPMLNSNIVFDESNKRKLHQVLIKSAIFSSSIIYDDNNKKQSYKITIKSEKTNLELLEHPNFRSNYTDGDGNFYTIENKDYSLLDGIATYAPYIYHSIENKIFQKKI